MKTTAVRINSVNPVTYVDGPGKRTVVYLQGCPIHCAGCQSRHTWAADGGSSRTVEELAGALVELSLDHGNITISGGEAFFQPQALAELVYRLKNSPSVKHIILYTGYTLGAIIRHLPPGLSLAEGHPCEYRRFGGRAVYPV